jgi:hypothetical protein
MRHVYVNEPLKPEIEPRPDVVPGLEGLEWLAWLMDRAIPIPGTPLRVGLDAIVGLLPIGGDVLTGAVQGAIVLIAMVHYRVPRAVAARMATNVLLDIAVGSIPLVGDAFDAVFKANTRNLQLLSHVQRQRLEHRPVATAPSVLYVAGVALAFFGLLALILIGFITVVAWLINRLAVG